MAVDTMDTNGYLTDFEWNRRINSVVDYATAIPQIHEFFEPNKVDSIAVRGIDDDGIWSEWVKFCVYPDEPPDTPSLGAPTMQGDSVKLVWENADFKDGDSTQFQILCDTNNPPTTAVRDFATCKKSGNEFYYWFHPQAAGRYRYRIVAQDARGSNTTSLVSSYFDYP